MTRRWIVLISSLSVATVGLVYWLLQPKPMTTAQESGRAALTVSASPVAKQKGFRIELNGTDAIHGVPTVKCGEQVEGKVTIVPTKNYGSSLLMVPRLKEQLSHGFLKTDVRSDALTALNFGKPIPNSSFIEYPLKVPIFVKPGEYTVRYYLFCFGSVEDGVLPSNQYLGEGHLLVVEGSKPGVTPLVDERGVMPFFPAE